MKNDIYSYLKFRLGDEYCNFEFEVIPLPLYEILENSLILEPYEYFGEISEIFGFRIKHIILYFNADILMKVELKIKGNKIIHIKTELDNLKNTALPSIMFLEIWYNQEEDFTVLVYQNSVLNGKQGIL
ncbi:hypothetical protein [Elizabethkingia anophelis]|uniref:hypothetical protein n=1 Tax=Elizabethkingia anophelis TaxID=1117645 RepID=UPI003892CB85